MKPCIASVSLGFAVRAVPAYYYEEGVIDLGGSDGRRIFLFVFFDRDRYDGYMWFSSLKR